MYVRHRLDDDSARDVASRAGISHSVVVRRAADVDRAIQSGNLERYGLQEVCRGLAMMDAKWHEAVEEAAEKLKIEPLFVERFAGVACRLNPDISRGPS